MMDQTGVRLMRATHMEINYVEDDDLDLRKLLIVVTIVIKIEFLHKLHNYQVLHNLGPCEKGTYTFSLGENISIDKSIQKKCFPFACKIKINQNVWD